MFRLHLYYFQTILNNKNKYIAILSHFGAIIDSIANILCVSLQFKFDNMNNCIYNKICKKFENLNISVRNQQIFQSTTTDTK